MKTAKVAKIARYAQLMTLSLLVYFNVMVLVYSIRFVDLLCSFNPAS